MSADLFAAVAASAAAGAAAMALFSFSFGSAVWGSGFCSKKLILCLMSLALQKSRQEDCECDYTNGCFVFSTASSLKFNLFFFFLNDQNTVSHLQLFIFISYLFKHVAGSVASPLHMMDFQWSSVELL